MFIILYEYKFVGENFLFKRLNYTMRKCYVFPDILAKRRQNKILKKSQGFDYQKTLLFCPKQKHNNEELPQSCQFGLFQTLPPLDHPINLAQCVVFGDELLICGGRKYKECISYHIVKKQYKWICSYPKEVELWGHIVVSYPSKEENKSMITLLSFGGGALSVYHSLLMHYRSVWDESSLAQAHVNEWVPLPNNHVLGLKSQYNFYGTRAVVGGADNSLLFLSQSNGYVNVIDLNTFEEVPDLYKVSEPSSQVDCHGLVSLSNNEMILLSESHHQLVRLQGEKIRPTLHYTHLAPCPYFNHRDSFGIAKFHHDVLMFGGYDKSKLKQKKLDNNLQTIFVYSVKRNKWFESLSQLPFSIYNCAVAVDHMRASVHIIGGLSASQLLSTHFVFRILTTQDVGNIINNWQRCIKMKQIGWIKEFDNLYVYLRFNQSTCNIKKHYLYLFIFSNWVPLIDLKMDKNKQKCAISFIIILFQPFYQKFIFVANVPDKFNLTIHYFHKILQNKIKHHYNNQLFLEFEYFVFIGSHAFSQLSVQNSNFTQNVYTNSERKSKNKLIFHTFNNSYFSKNNQKEILESFPIEDFKTENYISKLTAPMERPKFIPKSLLDIPHLQDNRPFDIKRYAQLFEKIPIQLNESQLVDLLTPRGDNKNELIEFYCAQDLFCSERFSRGDFKNAIHKTLKQAMNTGRLSAIKIICTYCLDTSVTASEILEITKNSSFRYNYNESKDVAKSIISALIDEGKRNLVARILEIKSVIQESELGSLLPKELVGILALMIFGPM
ncbi:hypothetical protein RFI_25849 [Reticulomyxa filosa]|uniref:Uncharacterized protein n=1 Tax=Reticulomyxa filosa TaxID=46433 RepID=X6MCE0_RETFI|nr:hypothetical protein RFI_25849 [Reticulomyxa filosa]|eukprot:ETO11529.1 hypothetical protein RFI_25849 [Reticulomyxa filosa]